MRVQLLVLVVYAWMCVDPFSSYLNDTSIESHATATEKKKNHYQDIYLNKSALRESKKKINNNNNNTWGLGITSSLYNRGLVQCIPPCTRRGDASLASIVDLTRSLYNTFVFVWEDNRCYQ